MKPLTSVGGDLALSLGKGTETKFLGPNFRMTVFRKKIPFHAAEKFLMTFLVIHCTITVSAV